MEVESASWRKERERERVRPAKISTKWAKRTSESVRMRANENGIGIGKRKQTNLPTNPRAAKQTNATRSKVTYTNSRCGAAECGVREGFFLQFVRQNLGKFSLFGQLTRSEPSPAQERSSPSLARRTALTTRFTRSSSHSHTHAAHMHTCTTLIPRLIRKAPFDHRKNTHHCSSPCIIHQS